MSCHDQHGSNSRVPATVGRQGLVKKRETCRLRPRDLRDRQCHYCMYVCMYVCLCPQAVDVDGDALVDPMIPTISEPAFGATHPPSHVACKALRQAYGDGRVMPDTVESQRGSNSSSSRPTVRLLESVVLQRSQLLPSRRPTHPGMLAVLWEVELGEVVCRRNARRHLGQFGVDVLAFVLSCLALLIAEFGCLLAGKGK